MGYLQETFAYSNSVEDTLVECKHILPVPKLASVKDRLRRTDDSLIPKRYICGVLIYVQEPHCFKANRLLAERQKAKSRVVGTRI